MPEGIKGYIHLSAMEMSKPITLRSLNIGIVGFQTRLPSRVE